MKDELKNIVADVKEQVAYLRELGVDSLAVKLPDAPAVTKARETPVQYEKTTAISEELKSAVNIDGPERGKSGPGSRLASLPSLTKRATPPPVQKTEGAVPDIPLRSAATPPSTDKTLFGDISGLPESAETIEQIRADIGNCLRCPLHEGRTQVVHTVGNMNADLMFVGEAPGADEDAKGEPFVGRAGQLLNKIIEAIGMKREEVAIGNINRCRPPGNRQPTLPEAHTCKPFLLREIAVIRPKVIVVLGNTALHNLLDTNVGITRMRGQFHEYFGVKVMPTFHPAYLLRDPSKKREVWDDLKKVRDYLDADSHHPGG
jgi:uracil-DNA glycosylase family 4